MAKQKTTTKKPKMSAAEHELLQGLQEFLGDLKSGAPITAKYKGRRIVLNLEPTPYDAAQVKATRDLLNASQTLFAKFLGVSTKTVQAWESGRTPSEMAARFLDEIRRNPEYWRKIIGDAAEIKDYPAA